MQPPTTFRFCKRNAELPPKSELRPDEVKPPTNAKSGENIDLSPRPEKNIDLPPESERNTESPPESKPDEIKPPTNANAETGNNTELLPKLEPKPDVGKRPTDIKEESASTNTTLSSNLTSKQPNKTLSGFLDFNESTGNWTFENHTNNSSADGDDIFHVLKVPPPLPTVNSQM